MPLEQTVYIVNNSGKIISSGKQLLSIFKEAKASYQEKKSQIKAERSLQRSQTFAGLPREASHRLHDYHEDDDHKHHGSKSLQKSFREHDDARRHSRRRSLDGISETGSRRSHRHKASKHGSTSKSIKPSPTNALTARNLKAASDASSAKGSKVPMAYRSPYAETLPMDQSRMDLTQVGHRSMMPAQHGNQYNIQYNNQVYNSYNNNYYDNAVGASMPRCRSETELRMIKKYNSIDLNLAYGEIPPDLESRIDLDPMRQEEANNSSAKSLVQQIQGLLDEAHCIQHSAGAMIKHLQEKPEAAAAVAFALAELSKLVTKLSPAVLGLLKGGSPAVFSLLASPQFLIGTGLAVGVTVVMFGGWKMIKQVKEAKAAREALAWQEVPMNRPAPMRTQSAYSGRSYDEALVVEEELSAIESWRRGIEPMADNESVEMELITPEADRATRADEREQRDDLLEMRSHRSARTHKTSKTSKTQKTERTERTHKTDKTHKTEKTHRSERSRRAEEEPRRVEDDARSAATTKTYKTAHSERSATTEEIEEAVITDDFDTRSNRSAKTHRTSKTAMTAKTSKTSKTNKTERMHKTHKPKLYDDTLSKSKESVVYAPPIAASEIGHRRKSMLALEDGQKQRARDDMELAFRPRIQRQESELFKSLFKSSKKDKSKAELVPA